MNMDSRPGLPFKTIPKPFQIQCFPEEMFEKDSKSLGKVPVRQVRIFQDILVPFFLVLMLDQALVDADHSNDYQRSS